LQQFAEIPQDSGVFQGASVLAVTCIADPATLESIACREGLSLAADHQLQHVYIASDCLEVINCIQKVSRSSYYSILREIDHNRSQFNDVNFVHEKRCFNIHAHSLACTYISLEHGRQLWLMTSTDISITFLLNMVASCGL
jgi:hypothetical protein